MNSEELRATVIGWLNEVKVWYEPSEQKWSDYIQTDQERLDCGSRERSTRPEVQHLTLWTNDHEYHISFSHRYMGCIASCRKPRAGENWTRGNDLHDGDFSKETFDGVMKDIVRYELVAKVIPPEVKTVTPNGSV